MPARTSPTARAAARRVSTRRPVAVHRQDHRYYRVSVGQPPGGVHTVVLGEDLLADARAVGVPERRIVHAVLEVLAESGDGQPRSGVIDVERLVREDGRFAQALAARLSAR